MTLNDTFVHQKFAKVRKKTLNDTFRTLQVCDKV